MEPDVDAFWDRIRILIKKSPYTQNTLSEAIGLNAKSLSVMMAKGNVPGTFQSYKIAKLLNTSVEYLVTGKETSLLPELSKYKSLTADHKKMIIEIISLMYSQEGNETGK